MTIDVLLDMFPLFLFIIPGLLGYIFGGRIGFIAGLNIGALLIVIVLDFSVYALVVMVIVDVVLLVGGSRL